jgi:hypothetical protein
MKKWTSVVLATTALMLGGPAPARAQSPPPMKNIFVDVNFGRQPNSQSFTISSTPVIYDEVAFISSTQSFDGAPFFDLTGGYRVWRDFSVALALDTTFSRTSASSVSASIPSPIFYDRRVVTTATVPDLEHKERSVHLMFLWTSPVTDKIDASVMLGPSYVKVSQGLVPTVTVPAGTQDASATGETQTASTGGFNFGGDVTYLITRRIGVGVMFRYVKATVDLPSVPGLKAGGFQVAGAPAIRFRP